MRKIYSSLLAFGLILFIVNFSFAQTPRDATTQSEGKTTFTNLAITGLTPDGTDNLKNPGVPAYIEMISCAGTVFYLYIDYDGILRIASDIGIGQGQGVGAATPPTAGWSQASGKAVAIQQ